MFGDEDYFLDPLNNAASGFVRLATYDTSGDGKIDANDDDFEELELWFDSADSGTLGVTDSGELELLSAHVNVIYLDHLFGDTIQGANEVDPRYEAEIEGSIELILEVDGALAGPFRDIELKNGDTLEAGVFDLFFEADQFNLRDPDEDTDPRITSTGFDLEGHGDLRDLNIMAAGDADLESLAAAVVDDGTTAYDVADILTVHAAVEDLTLGWAGSADLDPEARGIHYDARKLGFLEAYYGEVYYSVEEFAEQSIPDAKAVELAKDPFGQGAIALRELWHETIIDLTAEAVFQTMLDTDLPAVSYDETDDGLVIDRDAEMTQAEVETLLSTIFDTDTSLAYEQLWVQVLDRFMPDISVSTEGYDYDTVLIDALTNASNTSELEALRRPIHDDAFRFAMFETNVADKRKHENFAHGTDIFEDEFTSDSGVAFEFTDTETVNVTLRDVLMDGSEIATEKVWLAGYDSNIDVGAGRARIYLGRGEHTVWNRGYADTLEGPTNFGTGGATPTVMSVNLTGSGLILNLDLHADQIIGVADQSYGFNPGHTVNVIDVGSDNTHIQDYQINFRRGEGDDTINLSNGEDTVFGGGGDDVIDVGDGDENKAQGGAGHDSITGGTGADTLRGDSGNDTITGGAGDDSLTGDAGRDDLDGGEGADLMSGGDSDDTLVGGNGNDTLNGDDGDDEIRGGGGADTLSGGAGSDLLFGGAGNDSIGAGTGADTLYGEAGDDTLTGGDDDDVLVGGAGADALDGANGTRDAASYEGAGAAVAVDLTNVANNAGDAIGDTYVNIDRLIGSDHGDTLTGYATVKTEIDGGLGNDIIVGGTGKDTLAGEAGADSIDGGAGDDVVTGGAGADTLVGGAGTDTLSFVGSTAVLVDLVTASNNTGDAAGDVISGFEVLIGTDGGDTLIGESSIAMTIQGGAGADDITGGSAGDALEGGDAADSLSGGGGTDTLDGGGGADTLLGGTGQDILYGGADNDSLLGETGGDEIYGGTGDDILDGADGNDELFGGAGADNLTGGDGGDDIFGGDGNDTIDGGDDADDLDGGLGADSIDGGVANDILTGGDGNDTLDGEANNDSLVGGDGDDSLTGGTHDDTLTGGNGDDRFVFVTGDGTDVISDFVQGEDRIDFSNDAGVTVIGDLNFSDDGSGNAVIDYGTIDEITLIGIDHTSLGASDFVF